MKFLLVHSFNKNNVVEREGFKTVKFLLRYFLFFLFFISAGLPAHSKTYYPFPLNSSLIKKIKKQGGTLVSDRVGGYILRAENLASNKKYEQAIELLQYHYQKEGLTKLEKAHFAMHLGHLHGQNKNNKESLSYLQKALDSKALAYHQHLSTLYHIAHIYILEENYKKALEVLKFWFSINESPSPQSYILLAHCYYAKGQLERALNYVEKTISLSVRPMESWLQFAVAIYLKQKKYKKARPHLERLTALYPSTASHWKQLAGVYLYLDQNNHAFVTLDMANKMGHLKTKSEYLNLSSLYVEQGLPYQGAKLLKKTMLQKVIPREQKYLEFLAEAFWLAREGKEALVYLDEASKTAVQPTFFARYGQRLLDQEKWKKAERAFKRALNTKKIKETIKKIKNYKKELAKIYKRENDFKQQEFFQSEVLEKEQLPATDPNKIDKDHSEAQLKAPSTQHLENIYLGFGIALYQQKKYEEALLYFKKSIEVDDTFLSGYQWIDYAESSIEQQKKLAVKSQTH